ncbi:zinc finger, CCHC-type containing protein [Tanacetum coccineum]
MASMNTRLNIEKLDGNIVQKHGGSKQVGFKQLGPGVETGVHGVHDEKRVWFEVELQGAQGDREAEVFQVSNDDTAVAQRRLEDKQPEEKTNTDCLVKEQEKEYQTGWKIKTGNVLDSCNQRSTQQCTKSGVAKHLGVAGLQQQNGLVKETNVTLLAKVLVETFVYGSGYFEARRRARDILTLVTSDRGRNAMGDGGMGLLYGCHRYNSADVMMAMSVEELLDWIMDSGGSYHITYRRDYLFDFEKYDGGSILFGDGRKCRVRGTGKVQVQMRDGSSFVLDNVRYVPELRRNLISLGTLKKEGFTVKMQSGKIKVIKGSLVVLSGTRRANCVYTLDGQAVTRKTLKGRKQLGEYQIGWKIKTGNVLDFCNQRSTQQCTKSGVAKHLGVAGLQQQNGLVEETNVTLLAKVRCFLIQSGLSKVLWAEDTTISTYLVNKVKCIFLGYRKGIVGNKLWRLDDVTSKVVLYRNMGFNESGEYKKTFISSGVGTGSMKVLQGVGSQEVQTQDLIYCHPARDREQHSTWELFSYREDSNEAVFVVVAVEKIYAHASLTFNKTVACEVISKWKAGLKDGMDDRSDVYVLSNGCRKCSDDIDDYYWEYTPGDCDVEKNGKWSCIYALGSQVYQMVCTRLDIASTDVGMLDGFDRRLQTDLRSYDAVHDGFVTTEAGYMTLTKAAKEAIWLKGLVIESRFELKIVAGIATGALSKAIPGYTNKPNVLNYSDFSAEIAIKGLAKMKDLRFIRIWSDKRDDNINWEFDKVSEYLPSSLRFIKIVQLWGYGEEKDSKLRTFDLRLAPNLEHLTIDNCKDFVKLHIPADHRLKLEYLKISYSKLTNLNLGNTPNLKTLKLINCHGLVEFQMPAKGLKLEHLYICDSKLTNLHLGSTPNIEKLILIGFNDLVELQMPAESLKLEHFYICDSKLTNLHLGNAPNLKTLKLNGCGDLVELEMPSECLKLKELNLIHSKLKTLHLGNAPNLKTLELKHCNDLVELGMPSECLKLYSVNLSNSELIKTFHLGSIPNLTTLELLGCRDLVIEMPAESLKLVSVNPGHSKIKSLHLRSIPNLWKLIIDGCTDLVDLVEINAPIESTDVCPLHSDNDSPKFRFECYYQEDPALSFGNLERLISIGLCACTNLENFSRSICSLQCIRKLTLEGSITEPRDLDQLEHIKCLEIKSCWLLEKLPDDIGRLESLETLILTNCKLLQDIPNSICKMKCINKLHLRGCIRVVEFPEEIGCLEGLKELNIEIQA